MFTRGTRTGCGERTEERSIPITHLSIAYVHVSRQKGVMVWISIGTGRSILEVNHLLILSFDFIFLLI